MRRKRTDNIPNDRTDSFGATSSPTDSSCLAPVVFPCLRRRLPKWSHLFPTNLPDGVIPPARRPAEARKAVSHGVPASRRSPRRPPEALVACGNSGGVIVVGVVQGGVLLDAALTDQLPIVAPNKVNVSRSGGRRRVSRGDCGRGRTLLLLLLTPARVRLGAVGERLRRREELRRFEPVLEARLERLPARVGRRAVVAGAVLAAAVA